MTNAIKKTITAAAMMLAAATVAWGQTGTFDLTTWTGDGTGWNTATTNVLTITDNANVTVTGTASTNRCIVVTAGATASITLEDASITAPGSGNPAILLNSGANLTLTITGANTLTGGDLRAGLQTTDATLTIDGSGSLTANGTRRAAGIGGSGSLSGGAGGNITISGGTVTATSSGNSAGIGGGGGTSGGGAGGNITISGGTVTATSSENGPGIGRSVGSSNTAGVLKINGDAVIFAKSISDGMNAAGSERTGGILFVGANATGIFYGNAVTLTDNATIRTGDILTIPTGATLTIPSGKTLTNNGTVTNEGTITACGTVTITGTFAGTPMTPACFNVSDITAVYGQTLADLTLPTDSRGTFSWEQDEATSVGTVANPTSGLSLKFTPTNTTYYNEVTGISVTISSVGKATLSYTTPAALNTTYTPTLTLADVTPPTGYAWVNPGTELNAGNGQSFPATYTDPSGNYFPASGYITVNVAKANPEVPSAPDGLTATYGETLSDVSLADHTGWSWMDATESVGDAGTQPHKAKFTPEDTENFNAVENIDVSVLVGKADPEVPPAPDGLTATYGETLAAVDISSHTGWSWMDGTETEPVGDAGPQTHKMKFTPEDTDNYNVMTDINVSVLVNPKDISEAEVSVSGSYTYTGSPQTPAVEDVTVTLAGFAPTFTVEASGNINAGTNTATATAIGTGNFTGEASGTFSIGKANLTDFTAADLLTFSIPSGHIYNGEDRPIAVTLKSPYTGAGTITVKYNGETTAPKNAGAYAVTAAITEAANFDDGAVPLGEYVIGKATLAITGAAHTKAYDGNVTANDATVTAFEGKADEDEAVITVTAAAYADASAGTATLNITGAMVDNENYIVELPATGLAVEGIKPLAVTIIPDAKSKIYGQADPALTYETDPPEPANWNPASVTLKRETGEDVDAYPIAINANNSGGNYNATLSATPASLTITQATATAITSAINAASKTAYEAREAASTAAIAELAGLPSSVNVNTTGAPQTLPIEWATATPYNAKGAAYIFTGALTGNANIASGGLAKDVTVTVTLVTASNPTFEDAEVVILAGATAATASDLGESVLPTSGQITVENAPIDYEIAWSDETLDRTAVGNQQTFTGSISYANAPAWLTLPESDAVERKVSVRDKEEATIAGITPNASLTYSGTPKAVNAANASAGAADIAGLSYSYSGIDGTAYGPSATAPTNAGNYKATVSLDDPDYFAEALEVPFTITKATITTANAATFLNFTIPTGHIYNGEDRPITPPTLKNAFTGAGAITVKYNGETTAPRNAGTYAVTVDVAGGANFEAASGVALGGYTIGKADLTDFTAADLLTFAIPSGHNFLTATKGIGSVIFKTATHGAATVTVLYDGEPDIPINAGTYEVTAAITDAANFDDGTVALGSYTVGKADPIAPSAPAGLTAVYGQTLADVSLAGHTGWSWVAPTTSVGNAGTRNHKAKFTPDDTENFNVVEDVDVEVLVGKADPEVPPAPAGLTAVYGQTLSDVSLSGYPGWSWADGAASVGAAGAREHKAKFTPDDTDNYNIVTGVNVPVTVNAKPVTVTAAAKTKVFGESDPALTYTVTPALVAGDNFIGALSRAVGDTVGTYAIGRGTLSAGSNYIVTFVGAEFAVTAKPVIVTAAANTKIYGESDPALTYTVTPALVAGDNFTGALSRVAGDTVGTYAIGQGTLSAGGNYIVTFVGAEFAVTRKPIAVPSAVSGLVYDGTAQTGVLAGIGYTVTSGGSAANAGPYTAVVTPDNNHEWDAGANPTLARDVSWSIAKADQAAPPVPTLASNTHNSVTLTAVDGYQYREGTDGTWQLSNVFENLTPATAYNFYQRVAGTDNVNASPASVALEVTTEALVHAALPSITTPPLGSSVNVDDNIYLSVTASKSDNGTLSYQWYVNTSNSNTGGAIIDGATQASYNVQAAAEGTYYYYVIVTNTNDNVNGNKTASVTSSAVLVTVGSKSSSASGDRVLPGAGDGGDGGNAAVVAPNSTLSAEFTVGPNPVRRGDGVVTIYRVGAAIGRPRSAADNVLTVYDATGNVVNKIAISDNASVSPLSSSSPDSGNLRRIVGSWDLRDAKGRAVPEGAYLLRGTVTTVDGRRERVSVLVGVR